jgi:transposase
MNGLTDARSLTQEQQELLRRKAVEMVLNGQKQVEVAQLLGIHKDTVNRWVKKANTSGQKALAKRKRGKPPDAKLTQAQATCICRLIEDKHPEQLKLPFALWTREAVRELIVKKYGIKLAIRTMGNYLRKWGFTPQKPARQAIEQNDTKVNQWLAEQYPAIEARAKQEKALIYWGDEMGLRSDHQAGRSYSRKGKTPIVKVSGNRFRCNMISALNNKGQLAFSVFEGSFVVSVFLGFLQRLVRYAKGRKLFLIVDGHPVHKANAVKTWLKEHSQQLELFFLPGYSPELNPDELLNQELKATVFSQGRPRNKDELKFKLKTKLHSLQKQPCKIQAYFQKDTVRYAAG